MNWAWKLDSKEGKSEREGDKHMKGKKSSWIGEKEKNLKVFIMELEKWDWRKYILQSIF